jgi:hypothetical protein
LQLLRRPPRSFGDYQILIGRQLFKHRQEPLVTAITHRERRVPSQASVLGAAYRRGTERFPELLGRHLGQPFERRIHQSFARLKF